MASKCVLPCISPVDMSLPGLATGAAPASSAVATTLAERGVSHSLVSLQHGPGFTSTQGVEPSRSGSDSIIQQLEQSSLHSAFAGDRQPERVHVGCRWEHAMSCYGMARDGVAWRGMAWSTHMHALAGAVTTVCPPRPAANRMNLPTPRAAGRRPGSLQCCPPSARPRPYCTQRPHLEGYRGPACRR